VTEGVDEGPIICQKAVVIDEADTVETLSARILEQEHQLYPQALQFMAQGRLQIKGRTVKVLE
jgi:phosphoribosylglycinamide formyltransferase-1